MTTVTILGDGGHGRDLGEIAAARDWCAHFADDAKDFLPSTAEIPRDAYYLVGVNDPYIRRRLATGRTNAAVLVHPSVMYDDFTEFGLGTVVGAGTVIGPHVEFGYHVHVGPGCTITRTKVGDYTTIAPGVDIAGDVTIGEECLIGVGAVVSNLVTIGDRCTVGAGAVVKPNTVIPDDTTVVGVPARPLQRKGAA